MKMVLLSRKLLVFARSKELWAFALPLLFVFAAFASAAQDYWHGSDYYSIELDGEGDAFVLATLNLESISEGEVTDIELEIPYDSVQVYKVAQGAYGNAGFVDFNSTVVGDATILSIPLDGKLKKDGRTTIAVIYKIPGVAERMWRGYSFRFETMKDRSALSRYVGASIVVPEDMVLEGQGDASVRYRPSAMLQGSSAKMMMDVMPAPSAHFARNLDPGESLVVTGLYGKSWVLVYLADIAVVAAMFFLVLLFARIFSFGSRLREIFSTRQKAVEHHGKDFSFLRAVVSGGISAVSFSAVYFAAEGISRSLHGGVVSFLVLLLAWLLVLLSFGVPAYYGFRKNWKEGIAVFALSLAFSISLLYLFEEPQQIIYAASV